MEILKNVEYPKDIKNLDESQLKDLCSEIRELIIQVVEKNGGHFSANLGVVEIVTAIHYVFDTPKDKLVFDVGHQCYAHKILTGRKDRFHTLRLKDGLSGFPKIDESIYDTVNTGHASTALSIASGLCVADKNNEYEVISFVGDGALTGGLSMEALNNINKIKHKQIIIINDNGFAIDKSDCVIEKLLTKSTTKDAYKIVTDLNIEYIVIENANDITELIKALEKAKKSTRTVLIVAKTHKGHGYKKAENTPEIYHGYPVYDCNNQNVFSNAFGNHINKLGQEDSRICCVTAAMKDGCGLSAFAQNFSDRFFDVEIAEGHAMTFCSGLALGGLKPYFVVYSTFLQRAFDNLIHDVCLMNLPVTVCIDRAGFVSSDGETHQGIYDLSLLTSLPNLTIFQPINAGQLREILDFSKGFNYPLAIRYPKGEINIDKQFNPNQPIELGKWHYLRKNDNEIVFLATGAQVIDQVCQAISILDSHGINVDLVNACFVKPLDYELIKSLQNKTIITIETSIQGGGFGALVNNYILNNDLNIKVKNLAIADKIYPQGTQEQLLRDANLDAQSIVNFVKKLVNYEN